MMIVEIKILLDFKVRTMLSINPRMAVDGCLGTRVAHQAEHLTRRQLVLVLVNTIYAFVEEIMYTIKIVAQIITKLIMFPLSISQPLILAQQRQASRPVHSGLRERLA